ncbi:MAG: hypothetical protein RMX96_34690 [Nostoc sp. ChiSLP02]|nr:hypothetical protein [Nostoc sp. DedSLP05]MDZ8102456.1 hypothetical protein [Nostoc sp. DedSLP01]MDZ8189971.1 hypothetical protein [Nostoc sp. ChiSLP02]
MTQEDSKNTLLKVITNQWVLKLITILALVYLFLIPIGVVKKKFEPTDVAILIVILFFNSGLVERLNKLEFKDGSVSIEIQELKKQQETQSEKIAANTEIIQRLTALERAIADNDEQKQVVYLNLINNYELKHLTRLASNKENLKYELRQTLKQELRRLRALGFIESLPSKHINSMENQGNLRDYVKITPRGQEYLKLIEEVGRDSEEETVATTIIN